MSTWFPPLSKIEVTVKKVDRHFVVLEIEGKNEEIFWPRDVLPNNLAIGEKLAIECRMEPATTVQKIIENAKTGSPQNEKKDESMRKLLEELIN